MAERPAVNRMVAGSSPASSAFMRELVSPYCWVCDDHIYAGAEIMADSLDYKIHAGCGVEAERRIHDARLDLGAFMAYIEVPSWQINQQGRGREDRRRPLDPAHEGSIPSVPIAVELL